MKSGRRLAAVAACVLAMGLAGDGMRAQQPAAAAAKQTLTIIGSTTVAPIAEAFLAALKQADASVEISLTSPGSGTGATALIDGRCQIATMSRFMELKEFQAAVAKGIMPTATVIALDGVCVVVHPSNPVKGLTVAQVRDIYAGKTTNWKQLGGPAREIVALSRETSSGTYETFNNMVMAGTKMYEKVQYVASNPEGHDRAAATEGGISYVGLGFVDAKVKALEVEGILPSKKTITTGKYPLSRPLYLFTNGFPQMGSPAYTFVTFYLSEKGQEIVEAKGFVPVTNY